MAVTAIRLVGAAAICLSLVADDFVVDDRRLGEREFVGRDSFSGRSSNGGFVSGEIEIALLFNGD